MLPLLLAACAPSALPTQDSSDAAARTDLSVSVHPDVSTILVATWTQKDATAASSVEYSFDGTTLDTPVIARDAGAAEQELLGIPSDTDVTVTVRNVDGDGSSASAVSRTGSLPTDLLLPEQIAWDPLHASPERWMLVTEDVGATWYGGPFYAVIVDRLGRVVWYWQIPDDRAALYAQLAWDGSHLLIDGDATWLFSGDVAPLLYRVSLDLDEIEEIPVPGLVFAVAEEVDGAVLYSRLEDGGIWTLARHKADGTDEDIWSCTAYTADWDVADKACMANTLTWSAARGTVFYSMPAIDTVVEVDVATGAVERRFGGTEPGAWSVEPSEASPVFQHYPNWTPDGSILFSAQAEDGAQQMWAREFTADDATQTLTQIWSYTDGGVHYASGGGEAQRLANGDTLIGFGADGAVVEVSPEGELLWDLEWPRGQDPGSTLIGHATLLDDLYALDGAASP